MTKAGFKSITIPDSLYWVLSTTARINKISISKVIEGVIGEESPMPGKLVGRKPPGSSNPPLGALIYLINQFTFLLFYSTWNTQALIMERYEAAHEAKGIDHIEGTQSAFRDITSFLFFRQST
ncbi:MAG: hypothetical protein Q7J35_11195 [Candidatus Methanoperedens sp.]|nr:hypothetical protein [Candidatus Methanoperedens sp.]